MANDLALSVDKWPRLASHWRQLQVRDMEAFRRGLLIGKSQMPGVLRELEAAMLPAGEAKANTIAQVLVGSYPRHMIDEPAIYTRGMTSLLAEYPAAIGARAVDLVTRKCKFIPTRAEIAEQCEVLMRELHWAKFIADRTEEERKRRRDEHERRLQIDRERAAFLVAHNGKSPLDVAKEMGLFNSKGNDDGEGSSDKDPDGRGDAGRPDKFAKYRGGRRGNREAESSGDSGGR